MDFDVTDFNVRLRTIKIREVVIACIVAFILTIVVAIIFPEIGENEDLIMMPLLFFVLMFFVWALRGTHGLGNNFSKLFEKDNRREILYIFLINILFAFIVVAFISSFDAFYSFLYPENIPMLDFTPESVDPFTFLLEAISSIIFAPILEELIFRKLLFWHIFMRHLKLPFVGSALTASAMFAVCHSPAPAIAAAFVFSAACCLFYKLTGTVLFPLLMHIAFNGVSLLMIGAPESTAAYMEGVMLVYTLLLIVFVILAYRRITDDQKTVLISKLTKERNGKRISFGIFLDPFRRELMDWQRIRTQISEIKKSRR